jgi:uncharacterized protein with von Willebrand factor type A (vWA) domain
VPDGALERALDWLSDPISPRVLTPEEIAALEQLDLEELRQKFEERLREQTERHDGGNRWVGTGGTSPFGHSGTHPGGVRVGGEGQNRSAMQVAAKRRFRNLRHDVTLDVRQIGMALRRLRQFAREGRVEELDLDGSIDATARNAGDLELVFHPERKNTVKLLLLLDVGGSMTPFTRLSERLFSAAHKATHFKAFRHYYFHNCVYEHVYSDITRHEGPAVGKLLSELDPTWFVLLVGDASMHPAEITHPGGAIDYYHYNEEPGLVWLRRIQKRFPRSAWLNPISEPFWDQASVRIIRDVFPMFELTLDGLDQAVRHLRAKRV